MSHAEWVKLLIKLVNSTTHEKVRVEALAQLGIIMSEKRKSE